MNPTISIIIPTYNRAELLKETLDSVMKQTYEHWECIIVDDGSSDNTKQVVENYTTKDSRFKYYERPPNLNKGANACRNYGFKQSKGSFVKWFDSDDIMKPELLKKQINYLLQHTDLDCCIAYGETFKESFEITNVQRPVVLESKNALANFILNKTFFSTLGPLWKKEFLINKTLFDETLHKLQDTEFHFRMLLEPMKFSFIDESLFYIRVDNERISSQTTLPLLDSIFRYHYLVFNSLNLIPEASKNEVSNYIVSKLLLIIYRILMHGASIKERFSIHKIYKQSIQNIIDHKSISTFEKFKISLGIYSVILFKKGLLFFKIKEK
ncbi:glycosyltransferase family 2 protein [Aquaticitalea lipolytica]|uniref:glycosyltransferase family 2 protein n=1 Tax=Aquaticitalea lipolytica TaxID=1247562 RepID=UPI0024BA52CC|nr:glycosyltransferase family 2 protein [Aquaticitalea lipolytica]